uniref:Medium-chain acyl-CoA ligase ACSF2, mitochondrial n=1 Tax=Esox lucius TaxID=8010 RepID=A0A6Q2YH74_ESOLU
MFSRIAFGSQIFRSNVFFFKPVKALQKSRTFPAQSVCAIHVDSPPSIPTLTTSYAHGTSSKSLLCSTVGETLQAAAERWPDREALVFLQDGVRKTFSQFQQDVDQAAAGLLAMGLKRGERLGVWGPNTYEWVLFQYATAKAGIILVSVNPAYQLKELELALRKVRCNAVVCPTQFKTQKYCDVLRQICPEIDTATPGSVKSARLPDLRMVIVTDSRQPGMFHLEDVMQAGSSQHMRQLEELQKRLSFDDPVNIQFTSGTTGIPKGATLSHHNIVNNAYFIGMRVGYEWRIAYGTTENSPVTFCGFPIDNIERRSETVGCISHHIEAKVVDPSSGELLPLGVTGELMIRGYCVMLGYWDDVAKTDECITKEGWYKTGDIAKLDNYGYCRIEGRIKDMIIRGGENIYPAEIEQFLHTHPKVQEAQVIGVPDARMGEEVCACIRLKEGQDCSAEDIRAYCKGKVMDQNTSFSYQRPPLVKSPKCLVLYGSFQDPTLRDICE